MTLEIRGPPSHIARQAVPTGQPVSPPPTQASGTGPPRSRRVEDAGRPSEPVVRQPVASGSRLPPADDRDAEMDELRRQLCNVDADRRHERNSAREQHRINVQQNQQLQRQQTQLDARAQHQPPPQQPPPPQGQAPAGVPGGQPVIAPAAGGAHPEQELGPPADAAPVLNMVAPHEKVERIGTAVREAAAKADDKKVVLPKLVPGTRANPYNIRESFLIFVRIFIPSGYKSS